MHQNDGLGEGAVGSGPGARGMGKEKKYDAMSQYKKSHVAMKQRRLRDRLLGGAKWEGGGGRGLFKRTGVSSCGKQFSQALLLRFKLAEVYILPQVLCPAFVPQESWRCD